MKKPELTSKQKEEIEKFGANTWFVEYLYDQFRNDPKELPDQWKSFFGGSTETKENGSSAAAVNINNIPYPQPEANDSVQVIAGSFARILDNMSNSLTIPTATSQRVIPVKLLEENRVILNNYFVKLKQSKISYTHIIAWAIIKALKKVPSLNYAFTVIKGKPNLIKKENVNLGLAIDIEKKDGSRSLIVPNIKNANQLTFKEFFDKYEDLVKRSRKGQIDPADFLGTTISLTNPGTIGTIASVPRLMIGQGAIIATGAIQYPAEYQAMSNENILALGISKVMNISSTYDHRIIQGAESGLFLKEIHQLLLGEDGFYEEIFDDLRIPLLPLKWKTDYQPSVLSGHNGFEEIEKQARVLQLINIYRVRGHLLSDLDPLGRACPYHAELDPSTYNFTLWDLDREFITGGFGGLKTAPLRKILDILRKTYCEKIGVEYMHIQNPEEKLWLQSKMEPVQNTPAYDNDFKKRIFNKLVIAEEFEHFIHVRFRGHKRFSLEGSETLIPLLQVLLDDAASHGVVEVVFGMAHRGRLNVLANIVGKSYESIFTEFEEILDPQSIGGSGDVKYHLGATGRYKVKDGKTINVSLAPNPSHLEFVNPVVEGIVRAKQSRINDNVEHRKVMPILIHGDAAFAGQGVVAETLNFSQLSGYRTGGTIHIIINNQIGFTTTPEDARSSTYATDVAKMVQAPIFHVNGDDPEASIWVAQLAFEYKRKFKKDVVIDLFGYRRHGHNEGDEPGFTQPLLYDKIKTQPSVAEIYTKKLIAEKVFTEEEITEIKKNLVNRLDEALNKAKRKEVEYKTDYPIAVTKEEIEKAKSRKVNSYLDKETLSLLINKMTEFPADFNVHPKLLKFLEKRKTFLSGESADWALGEALAFGSLLLDGVAIRLSGQDSVRGTFSQRHLALTDIKSGKEYVSLNHLAENQAKMEALDSSLSEIAVLGFEYGYSTADPLSLVMWEAQFGDFVNAAQVIVDNFIVASNEKWKSPNKVVLLLPHGFEGQGPEHSSARLERFLTLCAQNNIQVCNITTPAQYFHCLRRQALHVFDKPLVLMTPKSLLRLPEAKSDINEFLEGSFKEVIDDNINDKSKVKRILLTTGKVYYDLAKYRNENNIEDTAIIRFEQLYPYDLNYILELIKSYANFEKVIWVQEEPKNMGSWTFISSRMFEDVTDFKIKYSGRPEGASPAVGSSKYSIKQQADLVKEAFEM